MLCTPTCCPAPIAELSPRGRSPTCTRFCTGLFGTPFGGSFWRAILRRTPIHRVRARTTGFATARGPGEMKGFLDATSDSRDATLWRLLATTGMRRGEALGLRWSDLDLDQGGLSIQRTLIRKRWQRSRIVQERLGCDQRRFQALMINGRCP